MEISGVNPEASVKLIKASDSQLEKVTNTILSGIEESAQSAREFHSTGHILNVKA